MNDRASKMRLRPSPLNSNRRQPNPGGFSLAGFRSGILAVFFASLVGSLITAAGALFVVAIYESILPGRSLEMLVALVGLFLCLYFSHGLLSAIGGRLSESVGLRLVDRYERLFLAHQLAERRAGRSRERAQQPLEDFLALVGFIRGRHLGLLFDLAIVPVLLVVLARISPGLAGFGLGIMLAHLAAALLLSRLPPEGSGRAARDFWGAAQAREQAASAVAWRIAERTAALRAADRAEGQPQRRRERDLRAIGVMLRDIAHSGTLAIGAGLVLAGSLSIGDLMASGLLMMRMVMPAQSAFRELAAFGAAHAAWRRLRRFDLARAMIESRPPAEAVVAPRAGSEGVRIDVTGLELVAPQNAPAASGASFALERGQCLMVTGASGSGKSLLLRRLCGIVGFRRGIVRIGERNLGDVPAAELDGLIGYLPQEQVHLPGSIAETIARFDPAISPDRIVETCRRLGIHEEIEALAGGYQAELPPGGPPLPANLLRMIGLARLLVADPPILVLDDPLRGLSAPVARRLVALLAERKREGAILVIALPELAATELADIALLLGPGRVLAQGPMAHVLSLGDARNLPGGPGKRSS